jgi:predicted nucleotidyltransferase
VAVAPGDGDAASTLLRREVESKREAIKAAVARHRGRRVRLFGAVARGDAGSDSDIDLLVDFEPDSSLFDLLRLTRELESLLGRRVDVVSTGGLKARDRRILAEAIDL